ncbi:MAG: FAD-dependent monooxygenase [Desulfuromonadaceae bacterium]|nr:FAD-dependent monooxygenase [Desulfuromonadaceae bacterium]
METCEVLIVGGGPAGSCCADRLIQAGIDVLLLDKQAFPRQKPCAGWITPAVLTALALDAGEYRRNRILQDINGFRIGLVGGKTAVTSYGTTVSYGIRRSEFDLYLLERSQVRRSLGEAVAVIEQTHDGWIVNRQIRTRLVVGAGGHFCPVARRLGASIGQENVVVAQMAEFPLTPDEEECGSIPAETPALFFCRDMKGYGWLMRKGRYLNVGLGRMDAYNLARHTGEFCIFLRQGGYLAADITGRLQGHAYRVFQRQDRRRCVADGALLIGDAAGVAQPLSGEGILPAIESAFMAADAIIAANGNYRREKLEAYAARLDDHYGGGCMNFSTSPVSSGAMRFLGARLLSSSFFTRHVLLNRWFLHTNM